MSGRVTHSADYDRGYLAGLAEAADMVSAERAAHLIASTRAPAAGALFRVEQTLRSRVTAPEDPVCVCGENFRRHTYEHNFVDAEHYRTGVIPSEKSDS